MIQAAVSDIVSPAVSAENPDGFFGEQIFHRSYLGAESVAVAAAVFAVFNYIQNCLARRSGALSVLPGLQPLIACRLNLSAAFLAQLAYKLGQSLAALRNGQIHAVAKFRVILKEGISPCGAVPFIINGIGAGGSASAVYGGAARSVGNYHAVAEKLSNQLNIGSLSASGACA